LTLDVDVLIPAAVEGVITADNVSDLRASAIVEAANGPTTVAADEVLTGRTHPGRPRYPRERRRGHRLVPRVGPERAGVFGRWRTVNAELERRIGTAFDQTIDQYDQKDLPDLRTAAYTLARETHRERPRIPRAVPLSDE